jgi:hypothetical protein
MLTTLGGSSWHPAIQNKAAEKNKKQIPVWLRRVGKVLSYSFFFTLAYDLLQTFPEISDFLAQFLP